MVEGDKKQRKQNGKITPFSPFYKYNQFTLTNTFLCCLEFLSNPLFITAISITIIKVTYKQKLCFLSLIVTVSKQLCEYK